MGWPGAVSQITRRRAVAQVIDAATGRPRPTSYVDTPHTVGIHAAGWDEMQVLPEGDRTREARVVVGDLDLRAADDGAGTTADLILHAGHSWRVMRVEGRDASAFSAPGWTEALIVREQPLQPPTAPPEPEP